ncbi:MAG: 2-oxoacid:acceptor oxidoreductase family protein [Candidatus Omnitrophica bacterium]|nr:2-oxoacid:acceptor oxidoreductase family protein [Candidatus Omnitrophota bacterium]
MTSINESIICAGFGGQGVITLGKVFAYAGMLKGFHVTWFPSYGAEVRGGTAHSMVKISSEEIASPIVKEPTAAVVMNGPSLDKFEEKIAKGGLLILNTSMVRRKASRSDIDVVEVPLTDEAIKLGNVRVANMIAASIYGVKKGLFGEEIMDDVIKKMAGKREAIIPVNIKAVERGMEIAKG